MSNKEVLILKIMDPTGITTHEIELNWGSEHLDRFINGSRIIIEGKEDVVIYEIKEYKSDKNSKDEYSEVLDEGMEREFNYYFDEGTEVMLDESMVPIDETFLLVKLRPYIGMKGIVKKVSSDFHAFSRGTSYNMDIDFDGELVKYIFAPYVIEYKEL